MVVAQDGRELLTPDERDRLVRLEERHEGLAEDMVELKRDVKSILATLSEARGGWKTLVLVAGAAGAAGAFVAKFTSVLAVIKP